jgi:hypothetical protein
VPRPSPATTNGNGVGGRVGGGNSTANGGNGVGGRAGGVAAGGSRTGGGNGNASGAGNAGNATAGGAGGAGNGTTGGAGNAGNGTAGGAGGAGNGTAGGAGGAGGGNGGPGEEREAERGLRGLVGSGSSQVSVGAALRARDAARVTDRHLADAEQNLAIVRRNWVPREELPRNR